MIMVLERGMHRAQGGGRGLQGGGGGVIE